MTKVKQNPQKSKPHRDFPLFAHARGYWAKKVRGRLVYFGKIANDPKGEAALNAWLDQKDDLLAGRTPRVHQDCTTIRDVANVFLSAKKALEESGEIAPRTFDRLFKTCEFMVEAFGRNRLAEDLRPEDFIELRATMARRWGPVALGNEIQSIRGVFRFAYESGHLNAPVRFGPQFKKPSERTLRRVRAERGSRLVPPEEIRAAIAKATTNAKGMILLAINGALGNTDLAMLPISALDLRGRWLDYPRSKTGVERRIPLWPETVKALKDVLAARQQPVNKSSENLVFIGRRGQDYIGNRRGYRVHQELVRVFNAAGAKGRTPYDLRHTFSTIAEGARDLPAAQSIMGHAASGSDMAARYRAGVSDDRLKAVTDHVRSWLFPSNRRAK